MGAFAFLSVLYWLLFCPLVSGEQVAFVEVFLEDHQDVLQGDVVQESLENDPVENQSKNKHDLEGDLVLVSWQCMRHKLHNALFTFAVFNLSNFY